MKLTLRLLAALILLGSCGNEENEGTSTPIDSTNVHGTAPARYGADNPEEGTRYEGADDTGLRSNTISSQDSAEGRR